MTRLLINEDDSGLDYYKLLPTQPDRSAFEGLIKQSPIPHNKFTQALEFFKRKLSGKDSDDLAIEPQRLADTLQTRLTVVAIHLGETDDPYLIFESLNAKGAPLTQADLIRNYLLLRLHSNKQQEAYEVAWLPMQTLLPGDHLTEFMRQYLMLTGEEVARSSIYAVLKRRLLSVQDNDITHELGRMQLSSILYAHIVGITSHANAAISSCLARLRRWEVATANPFLLKLLQYHSNEQLDSDEVVLCLKIIESFVVRRAICAVPTNQLKRIFLSLTKEVPEASIAVWLSGTLALGTSGRRWPKDEEVKDFLLRYRAYASPLDRCKFILESIEESYGHKEPATFVNATIEHIMPQTLSEEWIEMLGNEWTVFHERWLDLLSNLTLTAYNSELSNSPFPIKRRLLEESHFEINKWIAQREKWTEEELRARNELLFEAAKSVWVRPTEQQPSSAAF